GIPGHRRLKLCRRSFLVASLEQLDPLVEHLDSGVVAGGRPRCAAADLGRLLELLIDGRDVAGLELLVSLGGHKAVLLETHVVVVGRIVDDDSVLASLVRLGHELECLDIPCGDGDEDALECRPSEIRHLAADAALRAALNWSGENDEPESHEGSDPSLHLVLPPLRNSGTGPEIDRNSSGTPGDAIYETLLALFTRGRGTTPSRISLTSPYFPIGITWMPRQRPAIEAASSRAIARPSAFSQSD